MTQRKNKKVRKQRGSRVYGYGRISGGHRKGGSRGGVGQAGSKGHHRIGRIAEMIRNQRGFTAPNTSPDDLAVNIGELDEQLELLLAKKIAVKEGKKIKIDVSDLGYTKVMGKGIVKNPLHIHAEKITPHALEKIEAAGGKAITKSE
ncbi:MAG: uL15 family ribosomal protein [Candidatus Hodarchaeales archaeon]|jgi:large subunit ribosomal protein L15